MLKIFFLLFFFLTTSFNTLFCHPSRQRKIREGKFLLEGSNFRFYPSFLHLFLYKYSWNIIGYLKDRSLYIYLHWTRFRIKPILSYNTVTSDKITFKTNSHESKKMLCKVVTQANLLVFCSFFFLLARSTAASIWSLTFSRSHLRSGNEVNCYMTTVYREFR